MRISDLMSPFSLEEGDVLAFEDDVDLPPLHERLAVTQPSRGVAGGNRHAVSHA